MKYIDVKQAAAIWNLTERRITQLCRTGKIPNATKTGKHWFIPIETPKPLDGRTKSASDIERSRDLLPLPIGISDFKEAVSNYYYVDKTLMIRDFLDTIPKVSLFTRPRRFGKTLNMDMLRVFFEKTSTDTSIYFKDKNIWACGEKYRAHQGQYPVIFLSFKDVKFESWNETLDNIAYVLSSEYDRHTELLSSPACSDSEKEYFNKILSRTASESELTNALKGLSRILHEHYKRAPIIIIDEYDTPIQQGYSCGFYDKVILFMRNLFSGAFKDNSHLSYGFLTGILRVAKESIFSGLNNLKEHSIFDERYSEYFGFTKADIISMMHYYGCKDKYDEIVDWYDGYRFGSTDIFNPWSVINYLDDKCVPKAFWQATGSNDIIREIVSEATPEIQNNLRQLMQGESIATYIDTSVIYPEIKRNPLSIYSFLLMAGYLKLADGEYVQNANTICNVAIPNKEIYYVYGREILSAMSEVIPQSTALAIQQAIMKQDIPQLQNQLQDFMRRTISYFDTGNEYFYHGLLLGLSAVMNHIYRITSNRESGDGRYDIQMYPNKNALPGIIIELKHLKDASSSIEELSAQLQSLSKEALQQIDRQQYAYEMRHCGISSVLKLGIAFYKKTCEISYQLDN